METAKEEPFFSGKHKPAKRAMEPNIFCCMRLFSLLAVRKRIWIGGGAKAEQIESETDADYLYYAIVFVEYHDEEQT